jgi:biopolymer transport protein ExbD
VALRTLGSTHFSTEDHPEEIVSEINITPLVDVFLVLLIIFMVTTSVMSQMGVNVTLPKASQSTASAQPEGVIITLLPDGGVRLNQQPIATSRLGEGLKAAFAQAASRLVVLEGDQKALLGNAIQVMDIAKKAGAERFAIATSPEASKP